MDDMMYSFQGDFKNLVSNYVWTVNVYEDHVKIIREGKLPKWTSLQKEVTIYFESVSSIVYGEGQGVPSIIFVVPGTENVLSSVQTTNISKTFSVSTVSNSNLLNSGQFNNNYAVSTFKKDGRLKEEYEKLQQYFNKYKSQLHNFSSQNESVDIYDKMKKLKELQQMGIITDLEYEEKRQILLKQI